MSSKFEALSRQKFRRYFQPSRVVMAVLPQGTDRSPNIITLCFHMYCSYKPVMMAFCVQKGSLSFELLANARECVLAVPGDDLVDEAMYCGTESGRSVDKVRECQIALIESVHVNIPSFASALANIECKVAAIVPTGDHVMAIVEVQRFAVNTQSDRRPLLSIGPRTAGYTVLRQKGLHRLAVVRD